MKKFLFFVLLICTLPAFAEDTVWTVNQDNSNIINTQKLIMKQGRKKKEIVNAKLSMTKETISQNYNGKEDVLTIKNPTMTTYNHEETIAKKRQREIQRQARTADPYIIKINKQKYYLVKNKRNGNYTINDILGYEDSKSDLFKELKDLNTNKDTKITKAELKKADIRFVKLKDNKLQLKDKTQDYSLDNVLYIDLKTLRGSINNGEIGSFGYFDIYIIDNNQTKKIIGFITFDSDEVLRDLIVE